MLKNEGINLESILTLTKVMEVLLDSGKVTAKDVKRVLILTAIKLEQSLTLLYFFVFGEMNDL